MADDTTTPATGDGTDEDKPLGPAGEKALAAEKAEAAKLRAMVRELTAKAKRLDEIEDANKSEIQRAADAATAAEKRAVEAEARAMRLEVAVTKGLPARLASRLQGASREELEADADDLLATFPVPTAEPAKPQPAKPAAAGVGVVGDVDDTDPLASKSPLELAALALGPR